MFCNFCGKALSSGIGFCQNCGAPVAGMPRQESMQANGFLIQPGFSDRVYDPAIQAALKKNKKATGIFGLILVLAPIIVTLVLGIKDDNISYLGYGAVISAIFLLFILISAAKKKGEKQWDGIVIDKHTESRQERSSSSGDDNYSSYTAYIVRIQKQNGRIKELEEREYNRPYYDYLNIGDRVRYHPQFTYYYEKFDKRYDSYAICPICSTKNNIGRDTCVRCGVPIIK